MLLRTNEDDGTNCMEINHKSVNWTGAEGGLGEWSGVGSKLTNDILTDGAAAC